MSNQQTDNDSIGFSYKVGLRIETAKENQIVLDCYSGHGHIWNEVKKRTSFKFSITSIDTRNDKTNVYLKGDNIKYLKAMNLDSFDIIDLDSYGIPFKQLEIIFKKKYKGIIHATFIQSGMGRINNGLLLSLGYTKTMIKKCPTLFSKNGYEKFKYYLANHSILKVNELSLSNKHYLYFKLK